MGGPAGWLLIHAVFPLWIAAGLADWACHRATRIERTGGLPENLAHWLLFAQAGIAALAVALLEINAAVLALVAVVFVLHELTVWLELRYVVARRPVRPIEQIVHSFQELMPLVMLALAAVIGWEQLLALLGRGAVAPDWGWHWKLEPLPPPVLATGAAAVVLFNALPLAQETWACLKARSAGA
jgi:hypothetical protein